MIDPLELPIAAAIGAAIVIYSFSRVMLGLPSKTATVIAFGVAATLVLIVGYIVGVKRGASKSALTGTFGLAAVALILGGTAAGLIGEREVHPHHTQADMAERVSATRKYADNSPARRSPASLSPRNHLDGSSLIRPTRYDGDRPGSRCRSTPSNILFRNDADGDARLVIDMHPQPTTTANRSDRNRFARRSASRLGAVPSRRVLAPSSAVEGFAFVSRH
jgi:hypothetical protein